MRQAQPTERECDRLAQTDAPGEARTTQRAGACCARSSTHPARLSLRPSARAHSAAPCIHESVATFIRAMIHVSSNILRPQLPSPVSPGSAPDCIVRSITPSSHPSACAVATKPGNVLALENSPRVVVAHGPRAAQAARQCLLRCRLRRQHWPRSTCKSARKEVPETVARAVRAHTAPLPHASPLAASNRTPRA